MMKNLEVETRIRRKPAKVNHKQNKWLGAGGSTSNYCLIDSENTSQ